MRYCANNPDPIHYQAAAPPREVPIGTSMEVTSTALLWSACLLLLICSSVAAAGFSVLRAEVRLADNVLRLDADVDFSLSPAAQDALQNSVPLTLVVRAQVLTRRNWVWDHVVADLQQRYRIRYHALARQYVVTNLNSGNWHTFPTQRTALAFVGRIRGFPMLDRALIPRSGNAYGRVRAELDVESLPVPLRPAAYLSGSWRLDSAWYSWPL